LVDAALAAGDDDEQMAMLDNIEICRHDIRTLRPGEWLNDEVNNFFARLLLHKYPHIHFFSTFFYTMLVSINGYNYENVRRWTRGVDVFTKEAIHISIHTGGNHWVLAIITFPKNLAPIQSPIRFQVCAWLSIVGP
jgi:sentrin-specific protease 1